MRHTPLWQRAAAVPALVIASPFVALAALAIRFAGPGPMLYHAQRMGAGCHEFTMLKLRTMRPGSDRCGSITAADDSRILPAGRLIRRLKLDEIPQLLNVIRGDMALVGPRPEAVDVVAQYYTPWMMETFAMPPGVTGPGSLRFIQQQHELPSDVGDAARIYVENLLPRKLAYELVYVRNPSLRYELQLLARTVLGVLGGDDLMSRAVETESYRAEAILDEVMNKKAR